MWVHCGLRDCCFMIFFFFKQQTAFYFSACLVGSGMFIRASNKARGSFCSLVFFFLRQSCSVARPGSYKHLTPATNRLVEKSGGGGAIKKKKKKKKKENRMWIQEHITSYQTDKNNLDN